MVGILFVFAGTTVLLWGGYLYGIDWKWDLVNHFRLIGGVVQILCLVGFALVTHSHLIRLIALSVFIVASFPCWWEVAPYYFPKVQPTAATVGQINNQAAVSLLHMNVLGPNRDVKLVIQAIEELNPDIVTVVEYTDRWRQGVETQSVTANIGEQQKKLPFLKRYPYKAGMAGGNDIIYSKFPVSQTSVTWTPEESEPIVMSEIRSPKGSFFLIVVHPRPPLSQAWAVRHRRLFSLLAEVVNRQAASHPQRPILVVGDFNMTPWSYTYKKLLKDTTLKDSQVSFGIQPSWSPLWIPVPLFSIDQALITPEVDIIERKIGPYIGSDHRPVLLKFDLQTLPKK